MSKQLIWTDVDGMAGFGTLRVGLDESHCVTIIERRLNPADDREITVTNVDALIEALRSAVEHRELLEALAFHQPPIQGAT